MILVSNSFKLRASDIQTTPTIYSNHSSISCLLQTEHEHKQGRGMWKFNVNHLKDSAYPQQIEWPWQHWRTQKQRFEKQREWWDIGKTNIQFLTQKYGIIKGKRNRQQWTKMEKMHHQTLRQLQEGDTEKATRNKLLSLQTRLKTLDRGRQKGQQTRTRTVWIES